MLKHTKARCISYIAIPASIGAFFTLASFHPTINVLNGTPYNDFVAAPDKKKQPQFCENVQTTAIDVHARQAIAVKYVPVCGK